jgi:hypothetical protein
MIYLLGTFLGATAFIGLFVLYYVRDITTTVLSVVIYVLVYRILFIEVLGVITYSGLLL